MTDKATKPIMITSQGERSKDFLRRVLGAIPVGVAVVDADMIVQALNAAAEQITGIDAEEALGRSYGDVLQTHGREVADPLEEALATGKNHVNQRFYLRSPDDDGSLPIRHSASVLTDADGQVVGGVTIFADIGRQVMLERQLEGQRRYLRDVLRSIPDGVSTLNSELVIETWNDAAAHLTGIAAPDAIGHPCSEVLGTPIATAVESLLRAGGGAVDAQQASLTDAAGTTLPIEFSASAIQAPTNDHVLGSVVVFRDISERLAQRRALVGERRYLQQIFELAPYGIFTVDTELTLQTFNQAAETLTGFAASAAIGKPYADIVRLEPDSAPGAEPDPLPSLVATGAPACHTRLILHDVHGRKVPVRYSAAPLRDADDEVQGAIVIVQDISDIVAAERMRNEFISMVSHELRTPLTSIRGFVSALLDGRAGPVSDTHAHFLTIAREQSDHLLSLINDLLDLSRLDAGEIEIRRERLEIAEVMAEVVEALAPMAGRKQLTLTSHPAPDLPHLWADRQKVVQVLHNLLSNAIKFTPADGQVRVNARQANGDTLELAVSDTGIGIAPEKLERIFEPFYQVETVHTRHVGGTGLGLPIVRRIVEAHDGTIQVESEPGTGTTFAIYLPLSPPPATTVYSGEASHTDHDPLTVQAPRQAARLPRAHPLILIIDDDPATNALLRFTLEAEGYDVISAATGQDAIEAARTESPDLITLDILMPEADGFSVLATLKDDPATADIPVCIVSIVEDKVRGYKLGAIDYITKPFESEDLLRAVGVALDPVPDDGGARILVVEDDPAIVELVEMSLADHDYELLIAFDGVSALERLRHDRPHLVLLDIMIPRLDGYQFIRQAKADARTADIPIIVLSVRSMEEDINRALRLGATKYLTKPADTGEDGLVGAIQDIVQDLLPEEAEQNKEVQADDDTD